MSAGAFLKECAGILRGGRLEVCDAGHTRHETRVVHTVQGPLRVFDAERYANTVGYCTGDDAVSRSLAVHGTWEPHILAGLTALGVLEPDDTGDLCGIDIGCHVGWYTRLMLEANLHVLAVDGEVEHLDLVAQNCYPLAVDRDRIVVPCRGWIDDDTREAGVPNSHDVRVRLLKVDIESNERHAVRVVRRLLAHLDIDYVLLEISPTFRIDYGDTVIRPMLKHGYRRAFKFRPSGPVEWDWTLDFAQEEILFVAPGIVI